MVGSDGEVGEEEVPLGEAGDGGPAEVHDDLDEMWEVGVGLELGAHFIGEEVEEAREFFLVGKWRSYGGSGVVGGG